MSEYEEEELDDQNEEDLNELDEGEFEPEDKEDKDFLEQFDEFEPEDMSNNEIKEDFETYDNNQSWRECKEKQKESVENQENFEKRMPEYREKAPPKEKKNKGKSKSIPLDSKETARTSKKEDFYKKDNKKEFVDHLPNFKKKGDHSENKLEELIKSISIKKMPSKSDITQNVLIANPDTSIKLKKIVIEQLKHYSKTGRKKYSNKEIMSKINYGDRTRLKNSIIKFVGNYDAYKTFFTKKGSEAKYILEDIINYAKEIGQEKYEIPGIITERGKKMFQEQINKGINPVAAYTEVWCQQKEHKPFKIRADHLIYDKNYCRHCSFDAQANTIEDTMRIGYKNGFMLKESEDSYGKKIRERKNKRPVDVKLKWECLECGMSHTRSTQSLENPKTGCKICAARALEITKKHATDLGKSKGLELDMTDEEFEKAKEKMRKQGIRTTLAKLKWREAGKRVTYPYAYVHQAKSGSFKYKNIYNSPTRHPSSAEENEGRLLLQDIFDVKFDHTYLREIVGNQVEIQKGVIKEVHSRSHVDGHNFVLVNGKKYEVVYEFWEMYWHSKFKNRIRDAFKRDVFDAKGDIVFIKLTDQMDKKLWAKKIANQFKEQTGISIHDMIPQKSLQKWLGNDNDK